MTERDVADAMALALSIASVESPHPNPRVGAVIVAGDGQVIGRGAHAGPGTPHAERIALDGAGGPVPGATMVVTLEPCDHTGRTPPCTDAIIAAGIRRVVVGAIDPDRRVGGRGVERLRTAGIDVELIEESTDLGRRLRELDPGYFHHRSVGRPQVVLKLAATLDGQTAALDGTSQWVTGPEMRNRAHEWRASCDAVMVGAGTLEVDDPRLDVRIDGFARRQPRPVIIAGARTLRRDAQLWQRNPIVISPIGRDLPGGELVEVDSIGDWVDLRAALGALAERGVLRVLVEGGATLASSLLSAGLVDVGVFHLGAKLGNGLGRGLFNSGFETIDDAVDIDITDTQRFGSDLEIQWKGRQQ